MAIGAVVNLALTLGVIWSAPDDFDDFGWSFNLPDAPQWPDPPPSGWASAPQLRTFHLGLGWRGQQYFDLTPPPRSRDEYKQQHQYIMREFGYGFPCACMRRWCTISAGAPGTGSTRIDHGLWTGVVPGFGLVLFPCVPVVFGLVFNTITYAALAGGLWQIPLVIRRHMRRCRGRCPMCGYQRAGLRVNAPCPECGTPA
jgi:hypothetical protein